MRLTITDLGRTISKFADIQGVSMVDSTQNVRFSLILFGLAFIVCAWLLASPLKLIANRESSISVKGYASELVTADLGIWSGRFEVQSADLASAYQQLDSAKQQVIAFFGEQNIDATKLTFRPVETIVNRKLGPQGMMTDDISSYTLAQQISYQDMDVERVRVLAQNAALLLKQGVNLSVYAPQYFYQKLDSLKIDLLGKAMEDALNRARQLATHAESKVGALRGAKQGVFQITAENSTDVSDYGTYDTSSIQKTVKSVVTATFAISE